MQIKFLTEQAAQVYENGALLQYQTSGSSGFDVRALDVLDITSKIKYDLSQSPFILKPKQRCLVGTGLATSIDARYEIQIRSRSGLALKNGIMVLNSPGTIDSDYRGEIGIILYNSSEEDFKINLSDRIAQAVVTEVIKPSFVFSNNLSDSSRGKGGFGSTGV